MGVLVVSGCAAESEEKTAESSHDKLSAVQVACGANEAQIALSGAGAGVAVAGYLTAAAVAIEALAASGAGAAILDLGASFSRALVGIAGASTEASLLGEAIAAKDVAVTARLLVVVLGKLAASGDVRNVLTLGYRVLEAVEAGLISLDAANPVGIRHNLDVLNDGLRFACGNCGEQWACPAGVTATRMNEFDPTKDLDVDSPAITRGRACARGTTFWSTSSYLNQCFDCCADSYDDPQTSAWHACRAVCNAAYQ
jgi:hypothetical protein